MNSNLILFLTGCINPDGMSYTALQNPKTRKNQYIDAIRFYLRKTNLKILFVENSGNDISEVFDYEIKNKRLEILTFFGNDYDRTLGKGYGEMLIMEYANKYSQFLKNAEFIFKITGRYKILNINSFINNYIDQFQNFDLILNFRPSLTWADSRFFGFRPFFLSNYLLGYKEIVNDQDSINFENALSKAALNSITNDDNYGKFNIYPRYSAIIGTTGKKYNDSFFYWSYKTILLKIMCIIQKMLLIN